MFRTPISWIRDSAAAAVIAVTYIVLGMRSRFGGDGADQMTIIVFASLALAFGVGQAIIFCATVRGW